AILHLLYSRFWTRVMRDFSMVQLSEPFGRLMTQGMVLNHIYYRTGANGRRQYIDPADVEPRFDANHLPVGGVSLTDHQPVEYGGMGTMSKSKGNGVDPQIFIAKYGADTVRLFIMFASPPEQTLEWSEEGVQGQFRFLRRLWKAVYDHVSAGKACAIDKSALSSAARELRYETHHTLTRVTGDIGRRRHFNTAIAAVMKLLNALGAYDEDGPNAHAVRQEALEIAVLALSPIVPHVAHALWHELGHTGAIIDERWPRADAEALRQTTVEVIVQINGKLRGKLQLPVGSQRELALEAAVTDPNVQRFIAGKQIRKVIHVPDKLVNLVI
ncbi:MAG TPA: class I tRNA ligase family protein, partial [Steroidobacteraceae bacterium]|nr:class I tRNA ligase family protein [Steroidobacteraceae bacterium]